MQDHTPIAILGIGCRLPGDINDTDQLWQFLAAGRNAWSKVPATRYNEDAFYHPNPENAGTTNHRGGHFLDRDLAAFDAPFFSLSPLEAQALDPQQRLLLEVTYESLENAGIPVEHVRGSNTSVYVALFNHDFDRNIYKDPDNVPKFHITGSGDAIASNRISYTYDLKGASMTLDTGCSGSLVALHQACQSLRTRESTMAIASGVSLIINPDHMSAMSNLHMLNDDGRSYAFDARGSGYGRGEGATSIVLKRLDDALKSGDNIRAVIRSSGVNSDGKTTGITLPDRQAQQSLEESCLRSAMIEPRDIAYIEAHGTGTVAGDHTELQAIANVFCQPDPRRKPLLVGSIKSNIGHLESSSGLAGLIKTVLSVERGLVLPNADFRSKKPSLNFNDWNIRIPTKVEPWPVAGVRRACVNSFGYGGTNAHVILESHVNNYVEHTSLVGDLSQCMPEHTVRVGDEVLSAHQSSTKPEPTTDTDCAIGRPRLYVLSAHSNASLVQLAAKLRTWASSKLNFNQYSEELAYHLAVRRSMMQWRYSFVATTHSGLLSSTSGNIQGTRTAQQRQMVFIFTGQGAQWPGMGQELLGSSHSFTESIMKSDAMLRKLGASWSLVDQMRLDASTSRLHQSEIAQPASTALQIALVDHLASVGVYPSVVVGHSSGEIGAAYAAGSLSHASALKVSYCRSFVSEICRQMIPAKGAMLTVNLEEEKLSPLCAGIGSGMVKIACINSPSSTTVSGDEFAILELSEYLTNSGIINKRLNVDTAYHSHHMQLAASEYLHLLGTTDHQAVRAGIHFISTVTADLKVHGFNSDYWVENLVSKVRFSDALRRYVHLDRDLIAGLSPPSTRFILEIGPHKVLGSPIRQSIMQMTDHFPYQYHPLLERDRNAVQTTLEVVGKLFDHGHSVDLATINALQKPRSKHAILQNFPSYPWDHSRTYWHESRLSEDHRFRSHPPHDLLGVRISHQTPLEPCWRHIVSTKALPWLADHVVDGLIIVPGAAYICMAVEALRQCASYNSTLSPVQALHLRSIRFLKALVVPTGTDNIELLVCFRAQDSTNVPDYEFRVYAISHDRKWQEHCRGQIMADIASHSAVGNPVREFLELRRNLASRQSHTDCAKLYTQMDSNGNSYGPSFSRIRAFSLLDGYALSEVEIADIKSTMPYSHMEPHLIHPTTLDALLHTSIPMYTQHGNPGSIMPISIRSITISSSLPSAPGTRLLSTTSLNITGHDTAQADIEVFAAEGDVDQRPVLTISRAELRQVGRTSAQNQIASTRRRAYYTMKWAPDLDYLSSRTVKVPTIMSVHDFVQYLHHKQPQIAILEIGSTTALAFGNTLSEYFGEGISSSNFTSTCADNNDLQALQATIKTQKHRIQYEKLDIYQNALEQGFQPSSFDLVVALRIFADPIFNNQIAYVRRLLKPGGRLLLGESSIVREKDYANVLSANGFDGVEFQLGDQDSSMIISSRATEANHPSLLPSVRIIASDNLGGFAQNLCLAIKQISLRVSLDAWPSTSPCIQDIYVILDDVEDPMLLDPAKDRFGQMVRFLGDQCSVIWITSRKRPFTSESPNAGLVVGFARSARTENAKLRIITIDIQDEIENCLPPVSPVLVDLLSTLSTEFAQQTVWIEAEYILRNGQLLVPRLWPNSRVNEWLQGKHDSQNFETEQYLHPGHVVSLDASTASPGNASWAVNGSLSRNPLGQSAVEITVRAHSLDLDNYSLSKPLPQQFSGVITRVGQDVKDRFEVGDRVCAWTCDKTLCANYLRVHCENVSRLPTSVAFTSGAILPFPFMAAYYALVEVANLRKGESILVGNVASDTGKAIIQLATSIGAEVFALVSSGVEKDNLVEELNIPVSRIVSNSLTATLATDALRLRLEGFDMIFNDSHKDKMSKLFTHLAPFGTFVYMQPHAISSLDSIIELPADHHATFTSFALPTLMQLRPQRLAGLLTKAMSLFDVSRVVLGQVDVLSISEGHDVLQKARSRKRFGRVVLEADDTTRIRLPCDQTQLVNTRESIFCVDSTYIIAGGLGSLGMKLCRFLARCGAKTIIILSRRILTDAEKQTHENHLRLIAHDIRLLIMVCDISNPAMLDDVMSAIKEMSLPPIRGVIQAATVLQDRVLERMTVEDYKVPLKTKVHGTLNLSNRFNTTELDFFIMLSSLSGIVGSRGQANYAAGNTFQDALANQQHKSRTVYFSINLGLMENTDAYNDLEGQKRTNNLLRQGWLPMNEDEMFALLSYAISPEGRKASCRQIVTGIDSRSIHEAQNPTAVIQGTMFTHIRGSDTGQSDPSFPHDSQSRISAIKEAPSVAHACQLITDAVTCQLSTIIALEYDKFPRDASMIDLGLDSLLAVELKNWIAREFDAPIQASEILDEPSVVALATKILSRSGLMPDKESDDMRTNDVEVDPGSLSLTLNEVKNLSADSPDSRLNRIQVPPNLPIPNLNGSLELYIASVRPFLSDEQFENTCVAVQNFQDGLGQKLQDRLIDRSHRLQSDGWQYQLHVDGIYLKRREPIHPYGTFYGSHILTDTPHSQAERAAIISAAAFGFKQRLDAGEVNQDYLNEEPLCMESLRWLFNTNRQPGVDIDNMHNYPGNDYLVAMKQGQFFQVMLAHNGCPASVARLESDFKAILNVSGERQFSVAALTAEERNTWANLRSTLELLHTANVDLLRMIEAAAFVLCLDAGSPMDPSQRANQFLLGEPSNRWSDKSLQFVVCENGVSGYICEHTMLDAASVKQLNKCITDAIAGHETRVQPQVYATCQEESPKGHQFKINTPIVNSIIAAEDRFHANYQPIEFGRHEIYGFGKKALDNYKLTHKTGVQLLIQVAAAMFYGKQYPSWETVTTMPFHNGRLDWMQVVSEPMHAFCQAAKDATTPNAKVYELLQAAAKTHTVTRTRVARGHGFAAHLEALREVLQDDERVPALFQDSTWDLMHVTNTRKIKTDASDNMLVQEGGFFMPDPESVWVHYEIEHDRCTFWVQSTKGCTARFCEALDKAAGRIQSVLDSQRPSG